MLRLPANKNNLEDQLQAGAVLVYSTLSSSLSPKYDLGWLGVSECLSVGPVLSCLVLSCLVLSCLVSCLVLYCIAFIVLYCIALYCIDRRIYLNLFKSTQSSAGLKALKPAANGRYLLCKSSVRQCSEVGFFLLLQFFHKFKITYGVLYIYFSLRT